MPAEVRQRRRKGQRLSEAGTPEGGVYEWYQRGLQLLSSGDPDAAATLLARVAEAEPGSRSVREALARAPSRAALPPTRCSRACGTSLPTRAFS